MKINRETTMIKSTIISLLLATVIGLSVGCGINHTTNEETTYTDKEIEELMRADTVYPQIEDSLAKARQLLNKEKERQEKLDRTNYISSFAESCYLDITLADSALITWRKKLKHPPLLYAIVEQTNAKEGDTIHIILTDMNRDDQPEITLGLDYSGIYDLTDTTIDEFSGYNAMDAYGYYPTYKVINNHGFISLSQAPMGSSYFSGDYMLLYTMIGDSLKLALTIPYEENMRGCHNLCLENGCPIVGYGISLDTMFLKNDNLTVHYKWNVYSSYNEIIGYYNNGPHDEEKEGLTYGTTKCTYTFKNNRFIQTYTCTPKFADVYPKGVKANISYKTAAIFNEKNYTDPAKKRFIKTVNQLGIKDSYEGYCFTSFQSAIVYLVTNQSFNYSITPSSLKTKITYQIPFVKMFLMQGQPSESMLIPTHDTLQVIVSDCDNDGILEFIIDTYGRLFCYEYDGKTLTNITFWDDLYMNSELSEGGYVNSQGHYWSASTHVGDFKHDVTYIKDKYHYVIKNVPTPNNKVFDVYYELVDNKFTESFREYH